MFLYNDLALVIEDALQGVFALISLIQETQFYKALILFTDSLVTFHVYKVWIMLLLL